MEALAIEFAQIIYKYGTARGINMASVSKSEMDEIVRNWYKAQVKLHERIEEMPISIFNY